MKSARSEFPKRRNGQITKFAIQFLGQHNLPTRINESLLLAAMKQHTTLDDIVDTTRVTIGAGWHTEGEEPIDLDLAAVTFAQDGHVREHFYSQKYFYNFVSGGGAGARKRDRVCRVTRPQSATSASPPKALSRQPARTHPYKPTMTI
jgi:hypothetical protein